MKNHPIYKNLLIGKDGSVYSTVKNKYLKQFVKDTGYILVYIHEAGRGVRVHRLVAETYLTESEFYGLDVNHKDGVKANNNLDNLEWCTRSHNILHAKETGLNTSRGETHVDALHTEKQIREVCLLLESGIKTAEISMETGVSKEVVTDVRCGRRWVHVSREYNIKNVPRKTRLSFEKVGKICNRFSQGSTVLEVCEEFQISEKTANNIYDRKTVTSISDAYIW